MNRFIQGNSRRYFRYSIQCKYFVSPELYESTTDLYSNGIDYFNRATEDHILHLKTQVLNKLSRLSRHQDIFLTIVTDIFSKFDMVLNYLRLLNRGEEIATRKIYLQNQARLLEGFLGIQSLKEEAPKTYELLIQIEKKFLLYINMILETINESNKTRLHFADYPEAFRFVPEIREAFESHKIDLLKSDLLQMILSIEQLFEKGFEPFTNLATDYLLYHKHGDWILRDLNISACGLSFLNSRKYPNLTNAKVKLVLDNAYAEVIELDGKIVRSRYLRQSKMNETAIDFYFPSPHDQHELLAYLHRQEIENTSKRWPNAGNK